MAGFQCGICGKQHDHAPMAMAFRRPAAFFTVPEAEREQRVWANDDLCVVDRQVFLIRGVLELPIVGTSRTFDWGLWARVEQPDFQRYVDAWRDDTEDDVPPFTGWLAGGPKSYPESDGLDVSIRLRSGGIRPAFTIVSNEHPLGVDQRQGISLEKAHEFWPGPA
jgi:hypothetical protein